MISNPLKKLTQIKHSRPHSKVKSLFNFTSRLSAMTLMSLCLGPGVLPAIAKSEQARSADSFVDSIGVNVHLTYNGSAYEKYEEIIKPKLKELGIRHIRDGGFYDDTYFRKLKELASLGIKSTLQFSGTPTGEVIGIAKILEGAIVAIEGPNEPDLEWLSNFSYNGKKFPEGVIEYQKHLYAAVKGDPDTKHLPVLMPSMGWGKAAERVGSLEDHGDYGNMHSYPNLGQRPTYDIDSWFIPYGKLMAGSKPLMATEAGYHNLISHEIGVSETAATRYIPRELLEHFNRNIKRTFLYEFIDQAADPQKSEKELHYGLLRHDGSAKPSFKIIKNLITLLKDPGGDFSLGSLDFELTGDMTEIHHTLLQKRNGTFFLIVWQDAKCWDNDKDKDIAVPERKLTLTLNTKITEVAALKPIFDSTTKTPIWKKTSASGQRIKQLAISVPDHPLVLRLKP